MKEGSILTGSFPCIREAQPQGEHDREQDKVRDRLGQGFHGNPEI